MDLCQWIGVIVYLIISIYTYIEYRYFKHPKNPRIKEQRYMVLDNNGVLQISEPDNKIFVVGDKIRFIDKDGNMVTDTIAGMYTGGVDLGKYRNSVKYCIWAAITWPIWCWRCPMKPFNV